MRICPICRNELRNVTGVPSISGDWHCQKCEVNGHPRMGYFWHEDVWVPIEEVPPPTDEKFRVSLDGTNLCTGYAMAKYFQPIQGMKVAVWWDWMKDKPTEANWKYWLPVPDPNKLFRRLPQHGNAPMKG